MRTIWKYPLDVEQTPKTYQIPRGHIIRSVDPDPAGEQVIAVYIEVWGDLDDTVEAIFDVSGTGHPISMDQIFEVSGAGHVQHYIGTAVIPPFAWHVWRLETT